MKEYKISISSNEAKYGCRKLLLIKELNKTVEVSIPAGIINGAYVYANTPGHDQYGRFAITSYPVKIHVRHSKSFLVLFVLLAVWIASNASNMFDAAELEDTDSFISAAEQAMHSSGNSGMFRQFNGLFNQTAAVDLIKANVDVDKVIADIPHFSERYFLNSLDDKTLENFCAVYSAVSNFESEVVYPHPLKDNDELEQLLYLVFYECPELIQIQRSGVTMSTSDAYSGNIYKSEINYCMDKQSYDNNYAECASLVNAIAAETAGMSDYDKEIYIYNYLASNINYNKYSENCGNAFGALIEKQAKCDGICQAFKWVCENAGLPCLIISGTSYDTGEGHAWNIIQLNGSWYDLDLTADSRSGSNADYILYPALNVRDEWIRSQYRIQDIYSTRFNVPECASDELNYHVVNGNYIIGGGNYVQTYFDKLSDIYGIGGGIIYLQFENANDFNAFAENISLINQHWVDETHIGLQTSSMSSPDYRTMLIDVSFL